MVLKLKKQDGAILIVSLLLLIVMTVLAVSAVNMSSMDLRIVNNSQQQMEAEIAVQEALEKVISYPDNFDVVTPTAKPTIAVSGTKTLLGTSTITVNGRDVVIADRVCLQSSPDVGDSITIKSSAGTGFATGKFIKIWELSGSHSDAISGANLTITQGVRMRMLSALCP